MQLPHCLYLILVIFLAPAFALSTWGQELKFDRTPVVFNGVSTRLPGDGSGVDIIAQVDAKIRGAKIAAVRRFEIQQGRKRNGTDQDLVDPQMNKEIKEVVRWGLEKARGTDAELIMLLAAWDHCVGSLGSTSELNLLFARRSKTSRIGGKLRKWA